MIKYLENDGNGNNYYIRDKYWEEDNFRWQPTFTGIGHYVGIIANRARLHTSIWIFEVVKSAGKAGVRTPWTSRTLRVTTIAGLTHNYGTSAWTFNHASALVKIVPTTACSAYDWWLAAHTICWAAEATAIQLNVAGRGTGKNATGVK
jgi:hypothetical protein